MADLRTNDCLGGGRCRRGRAGGDGWSANGDETETPLAGRGVFGVLSVLRFRESALALGLLRCKNSTQRSRRLVWRCIHIRAHPNMDKEYALVVEGPSRGQCGGWMRLASDECEERRAPAPESTFAIGS
jgi:hypothetical protein